MRTGKDLSPDGDGDFEHLGLRLDSHHPARGAGIVIGGVSLGPSITQTVPASLSNMAWSLWGIMTIRAVGLSGANSTVSFGGSFVTGGIAATISSGLQISFGGTIPTNVDVSVAGGLWMGWTLSVAGSVQPLNVVWRSLN